MLTQLVDEVMQTKEVMLAYKIETEGDGFTIITSTEEEIKDKLVSFFDCESVNISGNTLEVIGQEEYDEESDSYEYNPEAVKTYDMEVLSVEDFVGLFANSAFVII